MSETVTAEFYGGPRDGEVCLLSEPQDRCFFQAPLTVSLGQPEVSRRSVYELVYVSGRPSINDIGNYRYRYLGTQEDLM